MPETANMSKPSNPYFSWNIAYCFSMGNFLRVVYFFKFLLFAWTVSSCFIAQCRAAIP